MSERLCDDFEHVSGYSCARCNATHCWICDRSSTTTNIKTALRYCPDWRCQREKQIEHGVKFDGAKFSALKEAWIDTPFKGVAHVGFGEPIQNLINAVTAIVDPDRTLRDEPSVKRRGEIAGFRARCEYASEQVRLAAACGDARAIAHWSAERDKEKAACIAAYGMRLVELP